MFYKVVLFWKLSLFIFELCKYLIRKYGFLHCSILWYYQKISAASNNLHPTYKIIINVFSIKSNPLQYSLTSSKQHKKKCLKNWANFLFIDKQRYFCLQRCMLSHIYICLKEDVANIAIFLVLKGYTQI